MIGRVYKQCYDPHIRPYRMGGHIVVYVQLWNRFIIQVVNMSSLNTDLDVNFKDSFKYVALQYALERIPRCSFYFDVW